MVWSCRSGWGCNVATVPPLRRPRTTNRAQEKAACSGRDDRRKAAAVIDARRGRIELERGCDIAKVPPLRDPAHKRRAQEKAGSLRSG